jgi:hypothetical protein
MKNRFRVVAVAALFVAGLAGACANDNKSGMMTDDGMSKNGMATEHKMCAKCGMACDANGMCPHCDAGKMGGSTTMK